MNRKRYKEVLGQLDSQTSFDKMGFPAFGASFRYIDSRLSVFGDKYHWGILIETIEVNPNSIAHGRNLSVVYRFGNHLCKPLGLKENSYLVLTSDGDDWPVFGEYKYLEHDYLNPQVQTMRIRGHIVPVPHDVKTYQSKGIDLLYEERIRPQELLRALTPEYREYFFLTAEEKQKEFREPIPLPLQLEQWRHPLIGDDELVEKPSSCEAFQQIAKVIATCDPEEYRPTEQANTHWRNWMIADVYL